MIQHKIHKDSVATPDSLKRFVRISYYIFQTENFTSQASLFVSSKITLHTRMEPLILQMFGGKAGAFKLP